MSPKPQQSKPETSALKNTSTCSLASSSGPADLQPGGPKLCSIGPFVVSGANLLFPITYIFGDVFTEVYGYAASRRAIWLGFLANGLLALMGMLTVWLPPAPGWKGQEAFATVSARSLSWSSPA